jgi:Amt family ammonium transporter
MERLEHSLLRGQRTGLISGVFFVDLDRFKGVNDTYGHHAGDEVLVAAAGRLTGVLRPGDTLARASGDEFIILCEDLVTPAQAEPIAARLDAALELPLSISGIEMKISASVGIALTGQGADSPEELIHAADIAMYRAKRSGDGHHGTFDLRDQEFASYQAGLELDMNGLLGRDELYLAYQPIVATGDGHITGAEALLRWAHPSRGLVALGVLVPLAERAGLIPVIGQWVLKEASAEQDHWRIDYQVDDMAVSVNVSAHQLMSAGFVDMVAAVVETSKSPSSQLTLEITESVFVRDGERALLVLNDLRSLGVKFALDDFGTGYSSLSYLLQFPVDIVKIDQSFVIGLGRDHTSPNQAIVGAVIQLAHNLGMTVVAEGVETAGQHQELIELGCDFCQGFYFARPMHPDNIGTLIEHPAHGSNQSLPALATT